MTPPATLREPGADPLARRAFALLFLLMAINHLDRQVVVAMFAPLKSAWSLTDARLGLLVSIVPIMVALAAVPLSMLADRWGRVRSIVAMALLWSVATIAGFFAEDYATLLGMRALVGLGEAAYGAVGVALLATLYPAQRRSSVLGAFFLATILGTTLGVVAGGIFVQYWGWRPAFVAAGLPGIVFALAFLAVMRGYREEGLAGSVRNRTTRSSRPAGAVLRDVFRPRTLTLACLGGSLQLMPVAMAFAWLPTYFARYYALDPQDSGIVSGAFVVASGLGVVASAALADRVARGTALGRLYVPLGGSMFTCAFFSAAFGLLEPGPVQLGLALAGAVVMMSSLGPVSAVVMDVVPPHVRATAAAILAVAQNLIGLAGGAFMVGALSDRYGLHAALAIIPAFALPAALCFALACRTYVADAQRATVDAATAPGTWREPAPETLR